MTNKVISDFEAVSSLNDSDILHLQRGGVDKKITGENLLSKVTSGVISTEQESKILGAGQTTVVFDNILVTGALIILSGPSVDSQILFSGTHYTVTATKTIELTQSYPAGTNVVALRNVLADRPTTEDMAIQAAITSGEVYANYDALRNAAPASQVVYIYGEGIGGEFRYDSADTTTADNGVTIIVDSAGRRWKRIYDGPVNVEWAGAVHDGITDDSGSINDAFALPDTHYYFPFGRYVCNSNLVRSGHVKMEGAGMAATVLEMVGTSSLVYTGGTAADEYDTDMFEISSMSFECPTVAVKSVVDASWTAGIGGTSKTAIIRDVEVTGTTAAGGFTNAFNLTNARNIVVESVRVLGDRDGAPISSTNAFNIIGDAGGAPVEMFFDKVEVFFTDNAYNISGWCEGLYFNNCAIVSCHNGIVGSATPTGRPLISIANSHINTDEIGVSLVGFVQLIITGNLLYAVDIDGTSLGYIGLSVDASSADLDLQMSDNNLQGILTGIPKNGIQILNGTASESAQIHNNIFSSFDTGVILDAGTSGVIVEDNNIFRACSTNVLDNSSNGSNKICYSTGQSKTHPDGHIEKWGSSVITLDASGNGTITFAAAFPNSITSAVACNGDPSLYGTSAYIVDHGSCTASTLAVSVRPNPGAVPVRFNWSAVGT